jgi:glycosyltransferase involved in cell wall biosynthesis
VLKYSIVVPLHNEQENVTDLYARLKAVMEASGETFEMVLVDDGSDDGTFPLLREMPQSMPCDGRKLAATSGQTAGLAAGFDHARAGHHRHGRRSAA